MVPVPPPSKTPILAVLAAILVLGACGGRSSGILGAGSGANEGGSSGTADGSAVETLPDSSVADSPSATTASSGNPVTDVDASTEATGAGIGSVDATIGLDASALIDATDATGSESDIMMPCGPASTGTYFVDPSAGHDDDAGTGSQACPFKSLTHSLSLVGDGGAPVTVEIVNTGAAPTLSQSTGEVFPITVPGGVTIIAEDTTKNTPSILVAAVPEPTGAFSQADNAYPCSSAGGCAYGFFLESANTHLSHLAVDGQGISGQGRAILVTNSASVSADHVTVQNFVGTFADIMVNVLNSGADAQAAGGLVLGPGVVVRANTGSSVSGALVVRGGTATIVGGQGADHTSFQGSEEGIWVRETGAVDIEGTPIDPAAPDVSDIDVDGAGLFLEEGGPPLLSTVRGLHIAHAGLGVQAARNLTMRASYVADNQFGLEIVQSAVVDLGNPSDYGRNIFVNNGNFDICPDNGTLAVGNIFGNVDCANGGKLDSARLCNATPAQINVANCTF
jgi:hypothetical protein